MGIDYRKEAMEYERKASTTSRLSKTTKHYTPKQASNLYQEAAKKWLQYAVSFEGSRTIYRKKEALSFALNNLTYAMRLAPDKDEREDIFKLKRKVSSKLEEISNTGTKEYVFPILSITFLLSALIFTSFSLTGYSIGGLVENNFRFIGTGLFILGLIFAFLHFKMKGKK